MADFPVLPGITETASGSDSMKLLFMLSQLHRRDPDMVDKLLSGIARLFTPSEPEEEEGPTMPPATPLPSLGAPVI